jgi:hypothetical protein
MAKTKKATLVCRPCAYGVTVSDLGSAVVECWECGMELVPEKPPAAKRLIAAKKALPAGKAAAKKKAAPGKAAAKRPAAKKAAPKKKK